MNAGALPTAAQIVVLKYLKQNGPSNATQIAHSLRVTPMAVRHQLAVLEKSSLVTTVLKRQRTGRPSHLYSLTDGAQAFFPNEYGHLAERLLKSVASLDGEAKIARLFRQIKANAVAQCTPRMSGKDFEERVAEMARIQTESGYMADWRKLDENTFELTEKNCALLQVARSCPYACECELATMQELLGAAVLRQEHIVKGDRCCRYLIRRTPRPIRNRSRRQRTRKTDISS